MEKKLKQKIDSKTKPLGSLGKLETIALKIGTIQQSLSPVLKNPTMLVFAGDHGIADEGVSLFPKEVTYQMVMNFIQGGAAINVFSRQNGLNLKVVDAGVDFDFPSTLDLIHAKVGYGTKNILKEPAMSIKTCRYAMEKGREILKKEFENGCNTVGFGEMGIGNTSSASLIMHKITGHTVADCTGRGTGHDEAGVKKKLEILQQAASLYQPTTPLEILATFGGLEIAMMCGAMLEAKKKNMLLLVDGFITTSAFLVASAMDKTIIQNALFCHSSNEKGHRLMLEHLNAEAIIDLGMRLGEGSGVAVAFPIIRSAVNFLNEMAAFEEAGVSNSQEC